MPPMAGLQDISPIVSTPVREQQGPGAAPGGGGGGLAAGMSAAHDHDVPGVVVHAAVLSGGTGRISSRRVSGAPAGAAYLPMQNSRKTASSTASIPTLPVIRPSAANAARRHSARSSGSSAPSSSRQAATRRPAAPPGAGFG